jgi:hypothetical protein
MMSAQSSWCFECKKGHPHYLSLSTAQEIAIERNGECLSDEYKNNSSLLLWQCAEKHQWTASLHNVKDRGSWCPTCCLPTEAMCGSIIHALFPGYVFCKTRLPWLLTAKGEARLEFDLWNAELRLALEYNGRQHYEVVDRFHPNGEADLRHQQASDARKAEVCEQNRVLLIVVPYTVHQTANRYRAKMRALARYIWGEVADAMYPEGAHLSLEGLLAALGL